MLVSGCRVVGIVGSEEKTAWLRSLGLDAAINYKTTSDLAGELKQAAPHGVSCYFDNVIGYLTYRHQLYT